MELRLFGLTGGVASGKSTVAARFRHQGLDVLDADRIARDVVEPGTKGLAAVAGEFGQRVLTAEGRLDRSRLGAIVFAAPERRTRLEAIIHPLISAETERRAALLAEQGARLACYEAALLVETGRADAFRPLVVVAIPASLQIARMCERDGLSEAQAKARLDAQLPLADKVAVADHVIHNDGTREQLEQRADEVLAAIRKACV